MYNDHKTAADRIKRTPAAPLELSRRTMFILSLLVLAAFIGAGNADFAAVQAGLI